MDDPQNTPQANSSEKPCDRAVSLPPEAAFVLAAPGSTQSAPQEVETTPATVNDQLPFRKRRIRQNLIWLFSLALAAFVLTSWILVQVDAPFGDSSSEPQAIVRAQLRALDRGELRPAYEMFSPRYRGQVPYEAWHDLVASHWRMFHAEIIRTETAAPSGRGVTLQLYLHGADDKDYRARFTLVRTDGRWWIDDVHWTEEMDVRDTSRT